MSPDQAINLARSLLERHNLPTWQFKLNTNKRRLGVCKYRQKTIEISVFHLLSPDIEIMDTLLHEIAHAIMPHHGHDKYWRMVAKNIGCTAMRCGTWTVLPPANFVAYCPSCNSQYKCNRRPRKGYTRYCLPCGSINGRLTFLPVEQ